MIICRGKSSDPLLILSYFLRNLHIKIYYICRWSRPPVAFFWVSQSGFRSRSGDRRLPTNVFPGSVPGKKSKNTQFSLRREWSTVPAADIVDDKKSSVNKQTVTWTYFLFFGYKVVLAVFVTFPHSESNRNSCAIYKYNRYPHA